MGVWDRRRVLTVTVCTSLFTLFFKRYLNKQRTIFELAARFCMNAVTVLHAVSLREFVEDRYREAEPDNGNIKPVLVLIHPIDNPVYSGY